MCCRADLLVGFWAKVAHSMDLFVGILSWLKLKGILKGFVVLVGGRWIGAVTGVDYSEMKLMVTKLLKWCFHLVISAGKEIVKGRDGESEDTLVGCFVGILLSEGRWRVGRSEFRGGEVFCVGYELMLGEERVKRGVFGWFFCVFLCRFAWYFSRQGRKNWREKGLQIMQYGLQVGEGRERMERIS